MRRIVATASLAIVLLTAASTWLVVQLDTQSQVARQSQALEAFSAELEARFLLRHRAELSWLSHQEFVQKFLLLGGAPPPSLTANLEQIRGLLDLDVVFLVTKRGLTVASSNPGYVGTQVSDRDYFQAGLAGHTQYSLVVGSLGQTPGLYASMPVFAEGQVLGVVCFRTPASQLDLALAANPGLLLLDSQGRQFSADPAIIRPASTWIWDGAGRVLASGHWNRVIRHPLSSVAGFTLVSLEPETWPWVAVLVVNLVWILLVLVAVSIWHQGRLARERRAEYRSRHERELLLANLLEGIAVLDQDGRLVWANPAFHRLVQTESGKFQSIADWWDPPGEGPWKDVFEGKRPWVVFESVLSGRQGAWTPVIAGFTATEGQFLLSVLDRSESHRSDQLLRQSQKLTVLGQLSGGIAHDLNNMLGVLMGMADLIKMTLSEQDPLQESVDLMLQTLTRAAVLAERMLNFARQTPIARTPVDIAGILRELQFLSRTALASAVDVSFSIPIGPVFVLGDENLLLSALLNLLINAGEALPDGGKVRVEARPTERHRVEVIVADEGLGMDKATLARIFEPFFSTKLETSGTGLGLSLVRRTILEHQGTIDVKSSPGKGTRVVVTLPISPK